MRPTESPDYKPIPEVGDCLCGNRYRQWTDEGSVVCTQCGQQWFVWEEVNEDSSNDSNVPKV